MKFQFSISFVAITAGCLMTTLASAGLIIGNYPQANDNLFSTIAATSGNLSKAAGFALPIGTDYHLDSVLVRLNVNDVFSSVSFSLFGDIGGNPGGVPLLAFTIQPLTSGIGDYTLMPGTSFVLQNSTTYWIAARGTSPTVDGVTWLASNPGIIPTGIAVNSGYRSDSSGVFPPIRSSTIDNTYQVFATGIPEPSTGIYALLPFIGLFFRQRRRPHTLTHRTYGTKS